MLKLNLKTEPYWIDLPGTVRVKVKPVNTAIMSAAQASASTNYNKMVDRGETDVTNDALRKGLSESLLVNALGKFAILEWENVFKANGDAPAEVNDINIEQLLDIWVIADEFLKTYISQMSLIVTEGNVFAPAVNGTLEAVPATVTSAK
ncbi:MAG: hypothetical protein IPP74_12415 [Alphaproteobacteria bacterium]|nr:hypothetical protein [Alphaproteobacteria bacterium]